MKYYDCRTKVEEIRKEKFDHYRQKKLFTDVTLIAAKGDEKKFDVHRAIMAAISPYVMFNVQHYFSMAFEI